ncbi:pectinesterase family protein [uncultured Bacteroides sp.]|uniref:pectinesterase family protein n=1 Tax=uncultured Bacteroides sp. TaxID=162156 RepID=UPI002AAC4213|nr:pectinesterase family protein [uncultured Bacteroides sp.]
MKSNLCFILGLLFTSATMQAQISRFPDQNAVNVNPDTHLVLKFDSTPTIGNKGFVRVFEEGTNKQVDCLDLSIPAVPTTGQSNVGAIYTPVPYKYKATNFTNANTVPGTPSGLNKRDTSNYQLNIIGHFTDGFHFYPVIVHDKTATIYLHNNLLEYGKSYYVTIDKGVINTSAFKGFTKKSAWHFTTKKSGPKADIHKLVVNADGTGDFNTVQGALDYIPDFTPAMIDPLKDEDGSWKIYVKNGDYEEIIYFRNKRFITIEGESREGVHIHYANNEVFNPHPADIKTNELPGTFPSRRAAFMSDNGFGIDLINLTIQTDLKGQAEGLLMMGQGNSLKNVHVIGSGDALQINGSTYLENCIIDGDGDTVLGRGAAFFKDCTLSSYGAFMWIRNTDKNHGNVFVDCTFIGKGNDAVIARSPANKGKGYPYAEAVLINCKLDNVPPVGWGVAEGDTTNVHFWEYNSRTIDGRQIDYSKRNPVSRQLDKEKDAKIIGWYSNPTYVLGLGY